MLAHNVEQFREIDREILEQVHEGRLTEAGRLLVNAYGGEVLGTCIARTGDEALGEDAAQDALARALRALPDYRGSAGLRPWLHRIAANRCIDLLRSQRSRTTRVVDGFSLEMLPSAEQPCRLEECQQEAERRLRLAAVRDALAAVKEPDRTWLELHYTHGTSYDELAESEGLSRAAVKQRIWRAVKKVRELVARDPRLLPDGGEV